MNLLSKLIILHNVNSALLIHNRSWYTRMHIIRKLPGLVHLKCTFGNNFAKTQLSCLAVRPTRQ